MTTEELGNDLIGIIGCFLEAGEETLAAIHEVHAAFGAPGDYGYNTKEGKALIRLYNMGRTSREAASLQRAFQDRRVTDLESMRTETTGTRGEYEMKAGDLTTLPDGAYVMGVDQAEGQSVTALRVAWRSGDTIKSVSQVFGQTGTDQFSLASEFRKLADKISGAE